MSGGHWNYCGERIEADLAAIALDPDVVQRWPRISGVLTTLGIVLADMEHDMDWDLESDRPIEDDREFEAAFFRALKGIATEDTEGGG